MTRFWDSAKLLVDLALVAAVLLAMAWAGGLVAHELVKFALRGWAVGG